MKKIRKKPKSFQVGSARSAKATNEIQKILSKANHEQTQNSNKPKNREPSELRSLRKYNHKPTTNHIQKAIEAKLASVDDGIV